MTEDEIIRSYLMAPEFDRKRQIYRLVDLAQWISFSICDLLRQHSITPPDVVFCDPAERTGNQSIRRHQRQQHPAEKRSIKAE